MFYPHQQQFDKRKAIENANHKTPRRLASRVSDYFNMIAKPKIGDGHRGPEGYKKPGSNKK